MKKKICVITGTRAEYGIFRQLLKKIKSDESFDLQIIATGMHMSSEFGLTYKEIEKDGYLIQRKVEMLLSSDSETAIAKSVGLGIIGIADALECLKPDLVVLLGDRFETLAAAISSLVTGIPIAHIHGGELTEGAIDDSIRHSITKMSLLHFVSSEQYRKRVIQLGESPNRVFNVGALGIDNIKQQKLFSRKELEDQFSFTFGNKNILVTFHPVTTESNTAEIQFKEILKALHCFKEFKIIFTKPNADAHGRGISRLIDEYVQQYPKRAVAFVSLGSVGYLSMLHCVDVVVGNSSSGIIEAPFFGIPTVNIGDRQKGRLRTKSIIDCLPVKQSIQHALKTALEKGFRKSCKTLENPYGNGTAALKIVHIIKRQIIHLDRKKAFCDLKVQ